MLALLVSLMVIKNGAAQTFQAPSCSQITTGHPLLIGDTLLSHSAGLQVPVAAAYLSAQDLYHMAIKAALRKKYAMALRLFRASMGGSLRGEQKHIDASFVLSSFRELDEPETVDKVPPSRPVKINRLLSSFQDGKKASGYGLYIHVKQPIPGKRKRFKWFGTVGHSFITLIKYNQDGTLVQRTFGYYPKKHFMLEATPIIPFASSDFKNDSLHTWDESVGLFITKVQFHKIIHLSRKYARQHYHLSRRNCTDFALAVADISGLKIMQTAGQWPLGSGNDPGDTGQSLLEGKIEFESLQNAADILLIDTADSSQQTSAMIKTP
ncbi:hypothetical protein SAMN05192529_10716 [Arachidicoccus rhizosphaerae]|uniref:Uncharacterized protein n=2 Tax=Arachidicoccus rhizosphaerae TaxID=551991 RepID=A0A1H3XZF9_9BACT|nr:hypothetical protein SAMN05192529_10716 [Arachidicoccus rhizosphaerae]